MLIPPPIHVLKGNPQRAGIRRWGPLDGVSPLAGGAPKSQCHLLPPGRKWQPGRGPQQTPNLPPPWSGAAVCGSVGLWGSASVWPGLRLSRADPDLDLPGELKRPSLWVSVSSLCGACRIKGHRGWGFSALSSVLGPCVVPPSVAQARVRPR